jgi:hypothetical protein
MTISTPGNAVDGMSAAVVLAAVEDVNGTLELQSNDVVEVNGSVLGNLMLLIENQ